MLLVRRSLVRFPLTNFTSNPSGKVSLRRLPEYHEDPPENGIVYQTITKKVADYFNQREGLTAMTLENESYLHSVPPGSETHFKLTTVSDHFVDKRLVQRHQVLNKLLAEELRNGVHALSLFTFTNEEWKKLLDDQLKPPVSPLCMGGSKANPNVKSTVVKNCDKPTTAP